MTKFATACQNLWKKIKAQPFQSLLVGLLFCVGLVLAGLFVAVAFDVCSESMANLLGIEEGEPSKKYKTLRFLGIGMGGVLVALQAVMSYRRAKAMEDAAQAQAKAVSKTEQGQRQERLKNAIEHLGNGKGSVRLGGAYELFHLAQDTRELRQTVLDILCAHIRQTTSGDEYRGKYEAKPSEEVQSMLTLLFVQEHEVFKNCHINLQGSWLNGADLRRARLAGANMNGAYLRWAVLEYAQLQGAHLGYARLQGAALRDAQLQGAALKDARLQGAALKDARLQGATSEYLFVGSFERRIRDRVGKESDLSGVIFAGGLSKEDVNSFVKGLPDEVAQELRETLTPHLGKPSSHEPPAEAVTGAYTAEDAERWIAEYKQATSEVPKAEAD